MFLVESRETERKCNDAMSFVQWQSTLSSTGLTQIPPSDDDVHSSVMSQTFPSSSILFLHFMNNNERVERVQPCNDQLFKACSIIDLITLCFSLACSPLRERCLDETATALKGRSFRKGDNHPKTLGQCDTNNRLGHTEDFVHYSTALSITTVINELNHSLLKYWCQFQGLTIVVIVVVVVVIAVMEVDEAFSLPHDVSPVAVAPQCLTSNKPPRPKFLSINWIHRSCNSQLRLRIDIRKQRRRQLMNAAVVMD